MASIHAVRDKATGKATGWRVAWRDADDRQRTKRFRTHAEAQIHKNNIELADTEAALRTPPKLGDAIDQWIESHRVSRGRTASDRSLSHHLADLRGLRLDKIDAARLRKWIAALIDGGYSAETIRAVLRLLRSVMNAAIDDRYLSDNPALRVKGPTITRPPLDAGDVFTSEELISLIDFSSPRYRALIALRGYTGVRWSEALAIRVRDLNLLKSTVHVGHRVIEEVDGVTRERDGGKTRGSDRFVPLPRTVVGFLTEHLEQYPTGRDQLLFRTQLGTSPTRSTWHTRVWVPARNRLTDKMITDVELILEDEKVADPLSDPRMIAVSERVREILSIPPRNLRHTAAAMMLQHLPPLEVARRLGHSRPSITLDTYARLLPRIEGSEDPYDVALGAFRPTSSRSNSSGASPR